MFFSTTKMFWLYSLAAECSAMWYSHEHFKTTFIVGTAACMFIHTGSLKFWLVSKSSSHLNGLIFTKLYVI